MLCIAPINVKVGILKKPAAKTGIAKVPCGTCINCRINQKRILQNRLILEACMWDHSLHVALTYSEEALPQPPFIKVEVMQNFIKKLRNRMETPIKYYYCGEYGFEGNRIWNPHYHAILYGVNPVEDWPKIADSWTSGRGKNRIINCDIEQIKPVELTPELAAYSCGYVAKKAKNEDNRWLDDDYGFMYKNFPKDALPFAHWSNGLGSEPIKQIKEMVDQYDEEFNTVRSNQRKYPLGRYLKKFSEKDKTYARSILEFWIGQQKAFNKRGKSIKAGKHDDSRRYL